MRKFLIARPQQHSILLWLRKIDKFLSPFVHISYQRIKFVTQLIWISIGFVHEKIEIALCVVVYCDWMPSIIFQIILMVRIPVKYRLIFIDPVLTSSIQYSTSKSIYTMICYWFVGQTIIIVWIHGEWIKWLMRTIIYIYICTL